jgi:HK97 gp10 family phage protein
MADTFKITIDQESLNETYRKITELGKRAAFKYARNSAAAGGRVIRDRARLKAKAMGLDETGEREGKSGKKYMRTGRIPRNITMKTKRFRGKDATALIGYRTLSKADQHEKGNTPLKKDKKNAWYARFVELGNPATGMPPRPFLRQGAASGAREAIEAAQKVVADGYDKEQAILATQGRKFAP